MKEMSTIMAICNQKDSVGKTLAAIREPLIKSTRANGERFFGTTRHDFAGIIVFISRNHNAVVTEKIRHPPQAIYSDSLV